MARRKKKVSLLKRWKDRWAAADAESRRKWGRRGLRVFVAAAMFGGAAYGLHRLEATLADSDAHAAPPRIVFIDRPADLVDVTNAALAPFAERPWTSPTLCADIADALHSIAWIKRVERVHRHPDRTIEIQCSYRRPVVMVAAGHGYCLVDAEQVRLPGYYTSSPDYLLVQGVAAPPPEPGEVWAAPELSAGIALARLVNNEPYAHQITGVLVQNFDGRRDARQAQIQLATDRAGGRIIWGSPLGEEIEENSADQKLELLRSNFARYGRVDAHRGVIDVSVHPDRIITSS